MGIKKIKSIVVSFSAAMILSLSSLVALTGVSYADGTVSWTGQGVSGGSFDTSQCSGDTPNPGDVLWVFTATGADSATITINGSTSSMTQEGNGAFHFVQTGFNGDFNALTASATFSGDTNSGNPQLVISHGCPPEGGQGGGEKDCDGDFDNSPQSDCTTPQPQKDCDGDTDNSPASECVTPQKDCDNDFDNSPASECATTTGQVLSANTGGKGAVAAQVTTVPQGSVNGGGGAASKVVNTASAVGLFGSMLSFGTGLALFNRRQS